MRGLSELGAALMGAAIGAATVMGLSVAARADVVWQEKPGLNGGQVAWDAANSACGQLALAAIVSDSPEDRSADAMMIFGACLAQKGYLPSEVRRAART